MKPLRLALAQVNPTVGSLDSNTELVISRVKEATTLGADLVVFGELALTGYPLEDLALQASFLAAAEHQVHALASKLESFGLGEVTVIIGHPGTGGSAAESSTRDDSGPKILAANSLSVLHRGGVIARYDKQLLPNYGVFDEPRVFQAGSEPLFLDIEGSVVQMMICEDLWSEQGPVAVAKEVRPELIISLNASPFSRKKHEKRLALAKKRNLATGAALAYVNLVGGQDELVFDGGSFVLGADGEVLARSPQFSDDLLLVDLMLPQRDPSATLPGELVSVSLRSEEKHSSLSPHPAVTHTGSLSGPTAVTAASDELEEIWQAICLGLRDYVHKNGFSGVLLGLSGGIDSALVATLAADALGPERVFGVSMPSVYSSEHSKDDAWQLAQNLGLNYRTEAIAELVTPVQQQLQLSGVAEENLQARIRGLILISISNSEGQLVLSTGNKTEVAVGYSTIYGDTIGGFAPIKDVPKTLVWDLARWRNRTAEAKGEAAPIPENSINKPPSAELKPGQLDQDSLPPYEILDPLLELLIEERMSVAEVSRQGFDQATVERIAALIRRSEWKRRQSAIGPKLTSLAFGKDRRMPITFQGATAGDTEH